jgi:uroporphyrinogen decarboxylase
VRTAADVEALRVLDPEEATPATLDAISIVSRELEGRMPLIGFAGGPFTVASYMIEGGSSRNYLHAKGLMYGAPDVWDGLMSKLADMTARYLRGQIQSGAQAVQIFDSWAGALSPFDYRTRVLPWVQQIVSEIAPLGVPTIIFGTSTGGMLDVLTEAGTDVVGVDWRIDLATAWSLIGEERAVQGNLDPTLLFGPLKELDRQVQRILAQVFGRPGHIFNLGHGILPETPVENVRFVAERVHELTQQ